MDSRSIGQLVDMLSRPPPNALTELQLTGCKFPPGENTAGSSICTLLTQLQRASSLSKLTLSNFKLIQGAHGDESGEMLALCGYLRKVSEDPGNSLEKWPLTHLNLSCVNFTPGQLCQVMSMLRENRHLQFLNLAGNKLHEKYLNKD